MKVLIIGSGGREHALAWKLAQSGRVEQIIVAPGNGGTAGSSNSAPNPSTQSPTLQLRSGQVSNLQLPITNPQSLGNYALEAGIDLTIVGPEAPLAAGIVDTFQARGLKIWGPTAAAAQLESSKAFAKAFMQRHNIPTAAYATFNDFGQARDYLLSQTGPVVIKASGLAAGKGVIVPDSVEEGETALRQIMTDKKFGAAGNEVVIETRLSGPEVSVLAFCDGRSLIVMPPAQDHKRVFDNDEGPNTGGMGAYAPAPICPPDLRDQIVETVLQPAVEGMRAEGRPYLGVLYAGLMLTTSGPKVLEFNCRLGDPEAQVILPLLETDLLEIIESSLAGNLAELSVTWQAGAAATVVLASGGYPGHYETGQPIRGLAEAAQLEGVVLFHAGTKLAEDGCVVTAGGRVLNVTGLGADLAQALSRAYAAVELIQFDGMHFRTDIGLRARWNNDE